MVFVLECLLSMCLFLFKYTSGKHDWTVFYLFCTCDACLSSPSSAVVVLVHFWCTVISLYKLLFSTVYSLPLHITASNEHDMIWTVLERLIVSIKAMFLFHTYPSPSGSFSKYLNQYTCNPIKRILCFLADTSNSMPETFQ